MSSSTYFPFDIFIFYGKCNFHENIEKYLYFILLKGRYGLWVGNFVSLLPQDFRYYFKDSAEIWHIGVSFEIAVLGKVPLFKNFGVYSRSILSF